MAQSGLKLEYSLLTRLMAYSPYDAGIKKEEPNKVGLIFSYYAVTLTVLL